MRWAAASFWTLDPIEEFRTMFDGSDWTIRGRQGGRSHCINDDLLTARSAISASCLSNWPDRKRLMNISNIRRHPRYGHKIETYRLGGRIVGRRAATI
jgi:hypothetical protein